MAIRIGAASNQQMYVGSSEVQRVYLGTDQVWPPAPGSISTPATWDGTAYLRSDYIVPTSSTVTLATYTVPTSLDQTRTAVYAVQDGKVGIQFRNTQEFNFNQSPFFGVRAGQGVDVLGKKVNALIQMANDGVTRSIGAYQIEDGPWVKLADVTALGSDSFFGIGEDIFIGKNFFGGNTPYSGTISRLMIFQNGPVIDDLTEADFRLFVNADGSTTDRSAAISAFGTPVYEPDLTVEGLNNGVNLGSGPDFTVFGQWGQPTFPIVPASTGPLTVTAEKTTVLPGETVRFEIDGMTQTEKMFGGYKWSMKDNGSFQHLSPDHRFGVSRDLAMGYMATHAWNEPGTVTPEIAVIRATGGPTERPTVPTITIDDPDTYFASRTWVVRASGSTATPPAGIVVPDVETAITQMGASGTRGRVLVERGHVQPLVRLELPRDGGWTVMIDAWGVGEKPKFMASADGFVNYSPAASVRLIVRNIVGIGQYNPETGMGDTAVAFRGSAALDLNLDNVELSGFQSAVVMYEEIGSVSAIDCLIEDWEDYGFFGGQPAIRGCRAEQSPLAVNGLEAKRLGDGDRNYPDHSFVRVSNALYIVLSHNQTFSNNGWSRDADITAHQPFLRMGSTIATGGKVVVTHNDAEGGSLSLNASASGGWRSVMDCAVIAMNSFVATANSGASANFAHVGVAVHSNLFVIPPVPQEKNGGPSFISYDATDPFLDDYDTKNIWFVHNTLVLLRSASDVSGSLSKSDLFSTASFRDTVPYVYGNLLYAPNLTLAGESEPIAEVPLDVTPTGRSGLYLGQRLDTNDDGVMDIFDTRYAQIAVPGIDGRPLAAAPESSEGPVPVFDFMGQTRTNGWIGAFGTTAD